MTTIFKNALGATAFTLCLVGQSFGYTISGGVTDVGEIDTFIAETGATRGDRNGALPGSGSSVENETAWINSILDPDTTYNTREETVSYYSVDGMSGVFAFRLETDPGYYILKNATNWAIFDNNASYGWGVFDISALTLDRWNLGSGGQMTISHVTEYGSATVPEPASLALLSIGLMSIAWMRRRQAN